MRREVTAPFRRFRHFHSHMLRCAKVVDFVASQLGTELSNRQIRFLDIGCNKGFVLANALSYGWYIYGVELVPELIAPFMRDHKDYRNQVYSGRFEDIEKHLNDKVMEHLTIFNERNLNMLACNIGFRKTDIFPVFTEGNGNFVLVLYK